MNELPKRKPTRLKNYDYSSCGAYFVTICTLDKTKPLAALKGSSYLLTESGKTVNSEIKKLSAVYESVSVEKYCIMPDHIHMIILIQPDITESAVAANCIRPQQTATVGANCIRPQQTATVGANCIRPENDAQTANNPNNANPPDLSRIIKQFKSSITKQIGCSIWQKSFYDRIIRNEKEYQNVWQYIDNNILKLKLGKID